MRAQLLAGVRALLVFTVITGLLYPMLVLGLGQLLFNHEADGSLVERDGEVVGPELIGQSFTAVSYFHPRPSAAGAAAGALVDGEPADPNDLTAVASGPSNLGPTNPALLELVEGRAAAHREENGLAQDEPVPVDAVAAAQGLEVDKVLRLVDNTPAGVPSASWGSRA